ncbi:MAG: EAL domain-containing protein, partial [Anaerolineae bacterium]|nr:EAL domain-containing protein [Anaerolineae bacterium]
SGLVPQRIALHGNHFKIVGAEALIRWKSKDGQIFTPDKFIPISETNGMIYEIGDWVFAEIFRVNEKLKKHGINIKLAINVSSKQLDGGSFLERVKEMYDEDKLQEIKLEVEITESFLLQNFEKAIESLLELKHLGVEIALDDFGTGFSSLNYLTRLPIDYLKIDRSFISNLDKPRQKNITSSIISMAKTLNLKTIAEGVETLEQVNILVNEACDELQGYYFSRPLEIDDFIKLVTTKEFKNSDTRDLIMG